MCIDERGRLPVRAGRPVGRTGGSRWRALAVGAAAGLALALTGGCAWHAHHDHDAAGATRSPVSLSAFVRDMPETTEYVRLLGRPDSLALHAGLVTLQAGEDCGWHSSEGYEELIICLRGAGHVESEGLGRRPLREGQYAYNPPWTRHCVFNTGDRLMRYVYVVTPVGADEPAAPADEKAAD